MNDEAKTKNPLGDVVCNRCGESLELPPPPFALLTLECKACGSRSFTVNPTEH